MEYKTPVPKFWATAIFIYFLKHFHMSSLYAEMFNLKFSLCIEFQRKVMTSLIQILEAVQRNGSAASTAAACVNLDDPVTIMSSSAKVEKFSKSLEKDKELYRKVVGCT